MTPDLLALLAARRRTGAPVEIVHADDATSDVNADTYTFSALSLGGADPARHIVVAVAAHKSGTSQTIGSVSVAGAGATQVVSAVGAVGINESIAALYIAAVLTGTTGDVIVTFPATQLRCGIAVYSMLNANAAEHGSDSSNAGGSLSLDVPASGGAIAAIYDNNGNTFTWTGLTEDADATVESPGTYGSASGIFGTAQSPLNVTAAPSGSFGNGVAAVAASWGR